VVGSPLIHARGLTKRFGDFTAVAGIDFDVQPGEAFGFLGPNGAGKSSTMRMIGCVSPPSDGTLQILGLDPVKQGLRIRARRLSARARSRRVVGCAASDGPAPAHVAARTVFRPPAFAR
jgi:ABC-type multidrug transport system ATPase subunit